MNERRNYIIAAVVTVLVIGWVAYSYFSRPQLLCWPYCPGMTDADRAEIKRQALDAATAGWQTYRNEQYGFEMRHPADIPIEAEKFAPVGGTNVMLGDAFPLLSGEIGGKAAPFYMFPPISISALENEMQKTVAFQNGNEQTVRVRSDVSYNRTDINSLTAFELHSKVYGDKETAVFIVFPRGVVQFTYRDEVCAQWDAQGVTCMQSAPNKVRDIVRSFRVPASNVSWNTYRNEQHGFEFQYPARFSGASALAPWNQYNGMSALVAFGSYKSTHNPDSIIPDEVLLLYRLEIPAGKSFENFILEKTVFGGSGLNPTSISRFKKRVFNGREFYSITTERFEGMLSFSYYLHAPPYAYRFDSIAQGVDWTNPKLDEENDPTHAALREMLGTLTFFK